MNSVLQATGGIVTLDVPTRRHPVLFLLRQVDHLLRCGASPSSVVVLADSLSAEELRARVTRLSGKRRTRFLRVMSTFDFLQSLLPSTKRAPSATRRALASQCAGIARHHGILLEGESNVDLIVLAQPDHPVTAAYLAGIERLGYVHPYARLGALHLPVGVRHLFHADFHSLIRPLKDWFLVAATQGANVVTLPLPSREPSSENVNGPGLAKGAVASDQSDDSPGRQIKCYPSSSSRLDALLDAAEAGHFTSLVFESDEDLRLFHLNCICFSEMHVSGGNASILYAPAVRLIYSLLDWLLEERRGSIDMVFEMLDGNHAQWREFAKRHGLPSDLSRAIRHSMSSATDTESDDVRLVAAIASLRADFCLAGSDDARLLILEQFVAAFAPRHLTGDMQTVFRFLRLHPPNLRGFRQAVALAWSDTSEPSLALIGPLDPRPWTPETSAFVAASPCELENVHQYMPPPAPCPVAYFVTETPSHG